MALPSPLMPAEILSQCIQRVEGGPSLGKSRCFEPWSRARTGRNGGSVPLSGASDADTRPWPGFPGGVKRLGCFDARPPCVLRPAGVLAPHWSARTRPTPHLHLPPPPERSWGRGSRGKLSFFSARFVNKGEKKMSTHKSGGCNVEISSRRLLHFNLSIQTRFVYSYLSHAPGRRSHSHHSPKYLVNINLF